MSNTTAPSAPATPFALPPFARFRRAAAAPLVLALAAAAAAMGGCDKVDSANPRGGETRPAASGGAAVAYVDLADLARQLRWDQEMTTKINAGRADLDRQRESFERSIARAIEEKNRQIATAARLNEQQTRELMALRDAQALDRLLPNKQLRDDLLRTHNNAGQYVARARALAEQAHNQYAGQVQKAYVDALRPIIRQVAEANGVKSVMTKVDIVVYIDPSSDLTNKVVDEAQKRQLGVAVPDVTPLNLPNVELGNPPAPATNPAAGQPTLGPTTRTAPALPPIAPTTPPR